MIVPRLHVGEGPEGEGALNLANVILEDPLRTEIWSIKLMKSKSQVKCKNQFLPEGLREVEAVFDLEGLAERPLLGAGAHHAGRDAPRVARLDAHVVNLLQVGIYSV